MKRSRKKILIIGAALTVVALIGVIGLWCWLAFRPTGIGALEKKLVVPTPSEEGARPVTASPPAPPETGSGAPRQSTGRWPDEGQDEEAFHELQNLVRELGKNPLFHESGVLSYGLMGMRRYFFEEQMGEREAKLTASAIRGRSSGANVRFLPSSLSSPTSELLQQRLDFNAILDRADVIIRNPALSAGLRDEIALLEGDDITVSFWQRMLILRACARGDEPLATILLDGYEESFSNSLLQARFSGYEAMALADEPLFLLRLGQTPRTPRSVFPRLAGILEQEKAAMSDWRSAHLQYMLESRESIEHSLLQQGSAENNTFSYMFGGRLQSTVRATLTPLIMNDVDRMIVAWSRADAGGFVNAYQSSERHIGRMNIFINPVVVCFGIRDPSEAEMAYLMAADYSELATGRASFNQFVLACAFHRHATGAWPADFEELTKEDRDLVHLDDVDGDWQIYSVPGIHAPALAEESSETGFGTRALDFLDKFQRMPVSIEELDASFPPIQFGRRAPPPDAEAKLERYFIDFEAFPIFVRRAPLPENDPRGLKNPKATETERAAWPDTVLPGYLIEWLFVAPEKK